MIIVDMCKERTCEFEDGTKIIYRKLQPKIFNGILLSNFNYRTNGAKNTGTGKQQGQGRVVGTFKDNPDLLEFDTNNTIVDEVLKHPNSIVRWEGVTDEDGNELEFDPKYIENLDMNVRNKLYECIAPKPVPVEDNGEFHPAEKKRRIRNSLRR